MNLEQFAGDAWWLRVFDEVLQAEIAAMERGWVELNALSPSEQRQRTGRYRAMRADMEHFLQRNLETAALVPEGESVRNAMLDMLRWEALAGDL
jgi:hypothetical protein